MRFTKRGLLFKLGAIGATAFVLPLIGATGAGADYGATPYDYVGVSGDTPQFSVDFLASGDPDGDPGFNTSGPLNRIVNFDAEPDANGRAAYYSGDTSLGGQAEDPTEVLRGGQNPLQRVSSSGNAILSIEADSTSNESIQFIASSTALSGTAYAVPLHEFEFGTDTVSVVAGSSTNAPASGLTKADLVGIYNGSITNWNQISDVSGYSGSGTIVPLLPPSTSAITKTFEASIGIASTALGSDVVQIEQNDPTAITLSSSPNNAIVPFSQARFNLLEGKGSGSLGTSSAYFPAIPGDSTFNSPQAGIAFPVQPQFAPPVKLLTTAATATVTDYLDVRQSDVTAAVTALNRAEPGAQVNWAQYLFGGGSVTPFIASGTGQALIAESGVTPVYVDKGSFQ
jgi:PBP superfamily domain